MELKFNEILLSFDLQKVIIINIKSSPILYTPAFQNILKEL